MDFNAVRDDLMALEGVLQVHDLHLWSLNMDKTAMAVHLAIGSFLVHFGTRKKKRTLPSFEDV